MVEKVPSSSINHLILVESLQVAMNMFEGSITDRVRKEVNRAKSAVETRIYDAALAAMDSLVILRVELDRG